MSEGSIKKGSLGCVGRHHREINNKLIFISVLDTFGV